MMKTDPYHRVLVISFSVVPAPDGQGVMVDNLIKGLSPRYSVDVLSLRAGDLGYVERYRKTRMLRVPVGDMPLPEQVETFRRAVRRQIEGNDYEIIHFRSAWGGLPICQRKDVLDAKLIFEVAISPEAVPRPADTALASSTAAEEAFCLKQSDLVVVHSQAARNHLVSQGLDTPISVVTPGVDIDLFDWQEASLKGASVLMYVGKIGPGRGIRTMLRAFTKVVSKVPSKLLLVGETEKGFAPDLEEALDQLELGQHVTILDSVEHEDLPRLISLAHVCLRPGGVDPARQPMIGCPLTVLEFMACKRPVVAPDSPIMRETAGGSDCFSFFKDGSAGDMALAILRLLEDSGYRSKVAENGYMKARSEFTASSTRRQILSVYNQALPQPPVLMGRPAIKNLPGLMEADPCTTTARRFKQAHDTAITPGRSEEVTVTPTARSRAAESSDTWELLVEEMVELDGVMQAVRPSSEAEAPLVVAELTEQDLTAAGEILPAPRIRQPQGQTPTNGSEKT